MLKPDSLRAAFTAAIVAQDGARLLERDPEVLSIYVDRGRLVAHLGRSRGFEYRYRLTARFIGFAGHPDAIAVPLLNWIAEHQSELLANHDKAKEAIPFEVDVIDAGTVDVEFQLELTETVRVTERPGGGVDLTHLPEPPINPGFADVPRDAVLSEVYLGGKLIVSTTPD